MQINHLAALYSNEKLKVQLIFCPEREVVHRYNHCINPTIAYYLKLTNAFCLTFASVISISIYTPSFFILQILSVFWGFSARLFLLHKIPPCRHYQPRKNPRASPLKIN